MTTSEPLTDAYLAELLAKDARDASLKYSSLGLAGTASKLPANKPRPNTTFLRHIIEETDNHNAALRAREAVESRARLEGLGTGKRLGTASEAGGSLRKRQLRDIKAILGSDGRRGDAKRKREPERERHKSKDKSGTKTQDSSSDIEDNEERRRTRRKLRRELQGFGIGDQRSERKRERDDDRRSRLKATHSERETEGSGRRERKRRDESDSKESRDERKRRRRRSNSPKSARNGSTRLINAPSTTLHRQNRRLDEPPRHSDSDSDPLTPFLGPTPPQSSTTPTTRPRGRGTSTLYPSTNNSGIDARFSHAYDPAMDVDIVNNKGDDWDEALEALRDRRKWIRKGAERLRVAGFSESEIRKWESGGEGKEKGKRDVKWGTKGEGREWDEGKVLDVGEEKEEELEEGEMGVEVAADPNVQWGRLKGT